MLHLVMFFLCTAGFFCLMLSQKTNAQVLLQRPVRNPLHLRITGFLLLSAALCCSWLSPFPAFYAVAWFGYSTLASVLCAGVLYFKEK